MLVKDNNKQSSIHTWIHAQNSWRETKEEILHNDGRRRIDSSDSWIRRRHQQPASRIFLDSNSRSATHKDIGRDKTIQHIQVDLSNNGTEIPGDSDIEIDSASNKGGIVLCKQRCDTRCRTCRCLRRRNEKKKAKNTANHLLFEANLFLRRWSDIRWRIPTDLASVLILSCQLPSKFFDIIYDFVYTFPPTALLLRLRHQIAYENKRSIKTLKML